MKYEIYIKLISACKNKNNTFSPFKQFCIKDPESYFKNKKLLDEYNSLNEKEKDNFKDEQKFFDLLVKYNFKTHENTKCNLYSVCKICENKVEFWNLQYGYKNTCSNTCSTKMKEQTNLNIYGFKHATQSLSVKEKTKQTNQKMYGFEYHTQNPNIKEKTKQTNLQKLGVENPAQSKNIKIKIEETNLKKYGFKRPALNSAVKEKVKNGIIGSNIEKYGVSNVSLIHIANIENLNENFTKDNFIENDRFLIEKFCEYFNFKYDCGMRYKKKFNIVTPNKLTKHKTQNELFDFIQTKNKILNDKNLIKPLELDIILPDIKLAIEYDGLMYHSSGPSKYSKFHNTDKYYHLNKTNLVEEKGYQLFHIFESDDIDIWKSKINSKLGLNNEIDANECKIKEMGDNESKIFLEQNHLEGYCDYDFSYGLYYEDNIVSLMAFKRNGDDFEILRFCDKKYCDVKNSFVTLLGCIKNKNDILYKINKRYDKIDYYTNLGFERICDEEPECFYFKNNNFVLYKEGDTQNKDEYRNIYDCGKNVLMFKK